MKERIKKLREKLLSSPYSLCIDRASLLTESMKETEGEPQIIRCAKALKRILERMKVQILDDELIVGTIVSKPPGAIFYPDLAGLMVVPEIDKIRERKVNPFMISDDEIRKIKEEISPYWRDRTVYPSARNLFMDPTERIFSSTAFFILTEVAGISHATINYPYLISKGLKKITKGDGEFYEATNIVAEALITYAKRYSELALLESRKKDGRRKDELERISEICRRVPENPPKDFYEALQFIWLFQVALHQENYEQGISIGRMDQFLYPFFKRDLEEGRIDREITIEFLQSLWLKTCEIVPVFNTYTTSFFGGLLTNQAVTIGGCDSSGKDVTNELSWLILDSVYELKMRQPNLIVRLGKDSPRDFKRRVCEVMKSGANVISVFNDEVTISALMKAGVSLQDARDYSITGCVECTSAGRTFGSTDAALFSLPICLELALNNGWSTILHSKIGLSTGEPEKFEKIEDVIDAFRKQVSYFVELMVDGSNCLEIAHKKVKPTPLLSLGIDGCLAEGKDVTLGSAKYNFTGVQAVGIADVADSLACIEKFVFRDKMISMKELLSILRKNFKGNEAIRQLFWNAPKYGNDDEEVDRFAKIVAHIFASEVGKYRNPRGGKFLPGIYSIGTQNGFGKFVGALPSGRRAREPFSVGVSPHQGCDRKGPTASLLSVAKVDHELFPNGVACNMKMNPRSLRGEKGTDVLKSLIETYFELGGMHLQCNIIDRATLLDAQKNPHKYQDLLVRVGGFSARFIDLGKEHQDEIISRTEHNAQPPI